MVHRRLLLVYPLVLALFAALPVMGATITVANTNDSGPGSLRAAIAAANPGDTINFSGTSITYPATIALTSGTLTIGANLTISGPGATNLAISGSNTSTVFTIASGTVSISGLTIEDGSGGGIINYGTLTVSNSTISGNTNSGSFGGGIFNTPSSTLTVSNSTISGNSASDGGGICNEEGVVTVSNSTISGNTAVTNGGGIFQFVGGDDGLTASLTVTNSTISSNTATNRAGGGISNQGQVAYAVTSTTVTLINSTIAKNRAGVSGGGISNEFSGANLTVNFSTISYNSAGAPSPNPAGGGILNVGAPVTLKNSIVAQNFGVKGPNCAFSNSTQTDDGHNLFSFNDQSNGTGNTCGTVFNSLSDLFSDPGLGSLANYGGPTQTLSLLMTGTGTDEINSPAVDAIPVAYCTELDGITQIMTDQRGYPRFDNGEAFCDIGAYEYQDVLPFASFSAKLDIGTTSLDLNSTFTLGTGSSGINPLTQAVQLQVGTYSLTIPAGSFQQTKKGTYAFSGTLASVPVQVQMVPLKGNSYQFLIDASQISLATLTNPVAITLTIGNNTGTTSVNADF